MEAKVHSSGEPLEELRGSPGLPVAHVRRETWWKLALVAILSAIILALTANAHLYFQQDDAPMQVEPIVIEV